MIGAKEKNGQWRIASKRRRDMLKFSYRNEITNEMVLSKSLDKRQKDVFTSVTSSLGVGDN